MIELLERYKIPLALCLVGVVLILGGIIFSPHQSPKIPEKSIVTESQNQIKVDVSGAITNPGVYQLKDGSIVEEAILAAGGFAQGANTKFISKYLNMAKKVSDGMKIYVPYVGEKDTDIAVSEVAGAKVQIVNINTGTQAELESLPGIGPVSAGKIISGRPYSSIDELVNKKIIGKAVFDKIKDQISIN